MKTQEQSIEAGTNSGGGTPPASSNMLFTNQRDKQMMKVCEKQEPGCVEDQPRSGISKHALRIGALFMLIALMTATAPAIQPPGILNYQGLVNVNGAAFSGTGQFKFALVDAAGATTYWSNDGTSAGGSEPAAAVSLTVSGGRYSVALGDTTVANMTTAVPAAVFADHADVRLRVWFNDGTNGFQRLSPDQRLASVGYTLNAASATTAENVNATNITGALALPQLPSVLVTNGASDVNLSGTFSGDGSGVTNVDLLYANTHGAISFTPNFILAASPTVGNSAYSDPYSVTAADVNGDGRLDLISANYGDSTLTVLTNDGSGGFVASANLDVGGYPESVIAADVNGDGHLDLISANYFNSTLTVLTNDGSGGFALASTLSVGNQPASVAAADVNGDGHLDLISANQDGNTLTVLTNDGSGGFVTASTLSVAPSPSTVTAVDINGDGHPDLICPSSQNKLTVLTNDGSGGFVLASSPGVGNGPDSATAADVNGDGHPDLISANYNANTLTVLTNDGSGGFVIASSPSVGRHPYSVTAADVNGDGYPDLISADSAANTLTVLTNDGSGGFVAASSPGVGRFPASVVAADVNGDGRLDLISANYYTNTLSVLFNTMNDAIFTGDGSGLTGLNATNLTGSVPAASLTSVPAASLTGTISTAQLPSAVVTNQETGVTLGGTFSGDGSALTNVPGDNLGNHTATQNLNLNGHYLSGDGDNEGVFVDANGNVGIGTNAPAEALDVNGNARLSADDPELDFFEDSNATTRKSAIRNTFATALTVPPAGPADQHMSFFVSDATSTGMTRVMDLLGNGYVGIGTTSPNNTLSVSGSADFTGDVGIGTATPHNTLSVAGNADITGNVGIGTTSPGEKLDVAGEIRFGSSHDRYPVAYDRKTVMVAGKVNASGNKVTSVTTSAAFASASRTGTGQYTITFASGTFAAAPVVTVTALFDGSNQNRYAVIGSISTSTVVLQIRNSNGNLADAPFNFIAIGQR